jgi:hypothetical protein
MADFEPIEFPDVESNDFIELADVEPHRQGFVIADHRAKWRLKLLLEANGVDHAYDQIFFTAHPVDDVIIFSKSLVEIARGAVIESSRESTQLGAGGAFYSSAHTTSEEANLNLDAEHISAMLAFVYDHIKETEARG